MKIKNISHILLALLFLFSYQINTVHSNQHFFEELDCHLCAVSEQLNTNIHETNLPVLVELNILEICRTEQRVSLVKPLVLKQKSLLLGVDFSGMHSFVVMPIPLGYFSHAPPYIFS